MCGRGLPLVCIISAALCAGWRTHPIQVLPRCLRRCAWRARRLPRAGSLGSVGGGPVDDASDSRSNASPVAPGAAAAAPPPPPPRHPRGTVTVAGGSTLSFRINTPAWRGLGWALDGLADTDAPAAEHHHRRRGVGPLVDDGGVPRPVVRRLPAAGPRRPPASGAGRKPRGHGLTAFGGGLPVAPTRNQPPPPTRTHAAPKMGPWRRKLNDGPSGCLHGRQPPFQQLRHHNWHDRGRRRGGEGVELQDVAEVAADRGVALHRPQRPVPTARLTDRMGGPPAGGEEGGGVGHLMLLNIFEGQSMGTQPGGRSRRGRSRRGPGRSRGGRRRSAPPAAPAPGAGATRPSRGWDRNHHEGGVLKRALNRTYRAWAYGI